MQRDFNGVRWNIHNFSGKGRTGGKGQWLLFCLFAVLAGVLIFILATVGLVLAIACALVFSLVVALRSRRHGPYVMNRQDGRNSGEPQSGAENICVELDREEYTVRLVEDEKTPPRA